MKTKPFHPVGEINSLDTYFVEISRYPLLTKIEERELVARLEAGEPGARDRLINANLRLVVSQAQKFKGLGLPLEDLIAEGNTGLITAVERFKSGMGAGVGTYAVWWIRQKMIRAIENHGRTVRLPVHILAKIRKIREAASRLTQSLGRDPEDWELAFHFGDTEQNIAELKAAAAPLASLDERDAETDASLGELIVAEDSEYVSPYAFACRQCDQDRVMGLLGTLPARLRLIIERRFGIGQDQPLALCDIGRQLGVTRERIRQLERKALALLRQAVYRHDPANNEKLLSMTPPVAKRRVRRSRLQLVAKAA